MILALTAVSFALGEEAQAERLNVQNSIARIRESDVMHELEEKGEVTILAAIYSIDTGMVEFIAE